MYLEKNTTENDVRRHLQKEGVEVREIWMLESKFKGTSTAKIRVAKEHRFKATNPSIWPIHCRIRDWDFQAKKAGQTN